MGKGSFADNSAHAFSSSMERLKGGNRKDMNETEKTLSVMQRESSTMSPMKN